MAFHSSVIAVFGSGPFVRTQKIPAQFLGFDAETECPIGQNLTEFRPNIGLERLSAVPAYWLRPTGLTRLSELPLQFVTI